MKLIIDINEELYERAVRDKTYHDVTGLNDINDYSLVVAQGIPYDERSQGEWIKWNFKTFGPMGDWEYKCSNCEKVYGGEYNFCPNCGSGMRKGGAE